MKEVWPLLLKPSKGGVASVPVNLSEGSMASVNVSTSKRVKEMWPFYLYSTFLSVLLKEALSPRSQSKCFYFIFTDSLLMY